MLLAAHLVLLFLGTGVSAVSHLTGDSIIVFTESNVTALNLAVKDVSQDWYKVLCYPPVVVSTASTDTLQGVSTDLVTVFIGTTKAPWLQSFAIPSDCKLTAPESHCIFTTKDPFRKGATSIVAIGVEMRGAIYAGYTFTEQILRTDPWYIWTDHDPRNCTQSGIDIDTFTLYYAPPAFKYRAFFTNDEDLLGGFKADPLGETVFDLKTWNDLFETLLRLKGNTFLVGTVPFPDEKSLKLASRRGLVIAHHHFNLLGIDNFRWPYSKQEWSWADYPSVMAFSWKACIAAQQDKEVVWSVGYRGLNDYPFPCPGCSDEDKADQINWVIGNQTEWIRSVQPSAHIITYLWAEGAGFYQKGLLKIPEGVHIVFTDRGAGFVVDLDLVKPEDGLYYHTAMLNGHANQLSEMVPPSRIFDQVKEFVKRNATFIFVLNTSDLRPVPLSTDAVMKFLWNPQTYMQSDPNTTQLNFITDWCAEKYEVSAEIAGKIANAYVHYFNTPYIVEGHADHYLAGQISGLAGTYKEDLQKRGNVSKTTADAARTAKPTSLPHLEDLSKQAYGLLNSIPQHRQTFFKSHLLTQVGIHRYACRTIDKIADSVLAAYAGSMGNASVLLDSAIEELDNFFAVERMGEYGSWRGLYMHDKLVNYHIRRREVLQLKAVMAKMPMPPVEHSEYYTFYDYQVVHNNFPYFYYNASWDGRSLVQITCANCSNTPDGGTFTSDEAVVSMSILNSVAIHYTLDGSEPSSSSSVYSTPIVIRKTTQVRARGFLGSEQLAILSDLTYKKIEREANMSQRWQ